MRKNETRLLIEYRVSFFFSLANSSCFSYSINVHNLEQRIRELEEQIAELKANWPAHSVQPWMLEQLEALEAELEKYKQENQDE